MDPSLVRFRAVVEGALAHLESRRQEINDLNVFPVADGDTGDNMALTLNAVLVEVDRLAADENVFRRPGAASGDLPATLGGIGRDELVESVARAALLGARGNSGVILSQLIRGAAEELVSRPGELVDPVLVAAAMARAAQRAYSSVREPAEGTILTVVRDMATTVASEIARMGDTRLEADADPQIQNALIADVLERALHAGEESVRRGPEQLAILRESGVVDAGGHALTVIFAGMIAALRGTDAPAVARHAAPARVTHPQHSSSTFRFCTNFAVTGRELEPLPWIEPLEALGDSVLVVGDAATLKIHVHTNEPAAATALFDDVGEVSHLDVADMHAQVQARDERLAPAAAQRCGALAVVAGDGMRALYASLGVFVLDGGPRSTRPPTSCSPESTTCRPRKSSSCPTRRTSSWRRHTPRSSRRRSSPSAALAPSRRAWLRRSRSIRSARPPTTSRRLTRRSGGCAPALWRAPRATMPTGASHRRGGRLRR